MLLSLSLPNITNKTKQKQSRKTEPNNVHNNKNVLFIWSCTRNHDLQHCLISVTWKFSRETSKLLISISTGLNIQKLNSVYCEIL